MNLPIKKETLNENLVRTLKDHTQNLDPTPFSQNAFDLLKTTIIEYSSELIQESDRIRERQELDIISPKHILAARDNLKANKPNKIYKHCGTLGGILFGAGFTALPPILLLSPIPFNYLIFSIISLVIGASLMTIHYLKDK